MKVFIDSANDFPDVKIICIGAVDTARELIQLDSNLFPGISEIHVPLLTDEEIKCFIEKGYSVEYRSEIAAGRYVIIRG